MLTSGNALDAITEMGVATDAAFTLSTATLSRLLDYMTDGDTTDTCDFGGTVSTSLTDADGNGVVSVGDTFNVQYANACYDIDMNDLVTGTVTLLINELDFGNSSQHVIAGRLSPSANFRADDSGSENTLTGSFDVFSFNSGGANIQEVKLVAGSTATITWVDKSRPGPANSSEVSEFLARKTIRTEADPALSGTLFELHMALDLDLLAGTIQCDSPTPVPDAVDSYPAMGGYLDCTGAAGSRVRVVGDTMRGGGSPSDKIFVDSGSGTLVEVGRFSRGGLRLQWLFERSIFGKGPPHQNETFEDVASTRMPIDITDSAYDAASGRLYVVDATDLIVYEGSTLAEIDRLALVDAVNTMALSDDGSTLWLAARDNGEFRSVDTGTMTYQDLVMYTSPGPTNSTIQYAYDIAVVPGTTDVLIATLNHRREIVMFNGSVELPGTLPLLSASARNFAILDSGSLAANEGTQSSPSDLRIASIDLVNGLPVQSSLTNYLPGSSRMFAPDAGTLFANNRVIDLTRESVSGELETLTVPVSLLALDAARDRIYGIRNSSQLMVYEYSTRRLIGAYFLDRNSLGRFRRVHIAGDEVLFTFENVLLQVEAADIGKNRGLDACAVRDLSGLLLPGLAFQLNCELEAVVYDSSRERLLLGFGADNGDLSYSVGIFEPQSATLEALIPVGANPGKLRITPDNQSLLVLLAGANEIAVIDLDTRQLSGYQPLGFHLDAGGVPGDPAIPTAIALLNGGANDFLVAMADGSVNRYINGATLPDEHVGGDAYVDLFASQDGTTGVSVFRDQSSVVDISSTGVAEQQDLGAIFAGPFTKRNVLQQSGDELFVFNGDVFDIEAESLSTPCTIDNPQMRDQIAMSSPAADAAIYVTLDGPGINLQNCDRASGFIEVLRPVSFFSTSATPVLVGGHLNDAGILMIATTEWLLAVDPTQ